MRKLLHACLGAALASAALFASPIIFTPVDTTIGTTTYFGAHTPSASYTVGGKNYVTNLVPDPPVYLNSADQTLLNILAAQFLPGDGWSFQNAPALPNNANHLTNTSLQVVRYVAVGTPSVVGADFMVKYEPNAADPTDIHWIQFVTTNHPLDGPHGKPATTLDISKNLVPYYDYTGAAGPGHFFDTPRRNDVTRTHSWTADLFLVTGPNVVNNAVVPGPVTIIGGIRWGWENHCVAPAKFGAQADDPVCCDCSDIPEPGTSVLFTSGMLASAGILWGVPYLRRRGGAHFLATRENADVP
jgi:hypothetical protein